MSILNVQFGIFPISKYNIVFCLQLEAPQSDVSIWIDGIGSVPMESQNGLCYQFVLNQVPTQFPCSIRYTYHTPSYPIGFNERRVNFFYPPSINRIYVNDFEKVNRKNMTKVIFNLTCEGNEKYSRAVVSSNFPLFSINGADSNQIQLNYNNESSTWRGEAEVNTILSMPISYKYYLLKSDGRTWEQELKNRIIVINNPIGGECLEIYDCYMRHSSLIPYYFPPIFLSANEVDKTFFNLNFCNRTQNNNDYFIKFDERNVFPLQFNGAYWNFRNTFQNNLGKLRYDIMANGSKICSPIFQVNLDKNAYVNSISTTFPGQLRYNQLTIFFSLITLRMKYEEPCGTFSVLSEMAKLVKSLNVQQIFVHIETLGSNNILLDPVQLSNTNVKIERNDTIKSIRTKKIEWVNEQYKNGKLESYKAFIQIYGHHFKNVCTSDFELYTQFMCYTELFNNFQIALQNGVCIITDVSMKNGIDSLNNAMNLVSLYSNVIFIRDMLQNVNSGITFEKIQNYFTPDEANVVSKTFFKQKGDIFEPLECFSNNMLLEDFLKFIEPSQRDKFRTGITSLFNMNRMPNLQQQPSQNIPSILSFLDSISGKISSGLVVEDKFSRSLPYEQLLNRDIIPSTNNENVLNSFYINGVFDPNNYSAYIKNGQFIDKIDIITNLRRNIWKNFTNYVIYLEDFLFCCDCASLSSKHETIEISPQNKKKLLNVTIQDIESKIERINSFLQTL